VNTSSPIPRPKRSVQEADSRGFFDYKGPVTEHCTLGFPRTYKTAKAREGFAFDVRETDEWVVKTAWAQQTEKYFMNILDKLGENYEAAAEMWKQYEKKLEQFRSVVKNDVSSLEATAKRAHEAGLKIQKVHADLFAQLNSAEMMQAITNAERLGAALKVIQDLESSKTTVKLNVSDF
jgi:hypothetical protein